MSVLGIVVSAVSIAFVIAFVAALRWCDRRDELDARRRASFEGHVADLQQLTARQAEQIGERLVHPLERQYHDLLRAPIDGQVTRDFWAGTSPPSPWPEDPHAPPAWRVAEDGWDVERDWPEPPK